MNSIEKKNFVRDNAALELIDAFPEARAITDKDYTFIVPFEVEGETLWAKIGITTLSTAATKVREEFVIEDRTVPAVIGFKNFLDKRAADAAAKAAAKAKAKN